MQQQISQSTVETALTHAEKWPMTVGFFLAVGLMGALAYWLLFKFWPAWQLEQEKHREHLSKALQQRGAEAQQDIAVASKLHESQQSQLVKELGGRIDKTHERVSDVHEVVKQIAQKVGVGVLALGLFAGAFVAGFGGAHFASRVRALAQDAERSRCNPPCATGWECRGGVCKEVKSAPASASTSPQSSLELMSFANYAATTCAGRWEDCYE